MRKFARFWRRRSGGDFADEIQAHIGLETDRLIDEGWSARDAADEAKRRFGNVGRAHEGYYDRTHVLLLDDFARDVRYALRSLAKDKAYVAAAVAALGVGLAANIALFSLFSAVALRPLPVPDPGRLVSISEVRPPVRFGTFSIADYIFYRDNSRTLEKVAIAQPSHLRLAGIAASATAAPVAAAAGAVAEPVIALFVTTNYFETFGTRPVAGRSLRAEDETGNGAFAAMISDNYWERRFARDPSVIGSTLVVSGIRANIVGVTPRDFAGIRQEVPDLWITLSALGDIRQRAAREANACCEMVGRLASRYTLRDAQGELATLAALRRQGLPPSDRQMTVTVSPAISFGRLGEQVRPLFAALQVAMLLVLFIACANVASLMLGRAAAREREITLRLATGAGRGRLVRQLLTEGLVVAVVSGALAAIVTGYVLATGARSLSALLSRQGGGTLSLTISANGNLALYVTGVSILAGIMFALAPALRASRADLVGILRIAGGTGASAEMSRLRTILIAGQITLSVALLIVATALARSGARLVRADPGFRPEGVLSVWLTNPQELALPAARAREIEAEVRRRVAAQPNVEAMAVASRIPLGGNVSTSPMMPADRARSVDGGAAGPSYPYSFVSKAYFITLGIPLIRGRTFTEQEVRDGAPVAVISDSMARELWPGGDALGKEIALSSGRVSPFNAGPGLEGNARVIGVVGNIRGVSMTGPDVGDVYLPRLTNDWSSRILVRTRGDAAALIRELPRIVHDIEPALPVSVEDMTDVVASDASVMTARVSAGILAVVGVIGLLLASVGAYGAVSYAVRQKQRDIGIRIALGATRGRVLVTTLRETIAWLRWGVGAGVGLGIVGVKLTNSVLSGATVSASALDPASIVLVPAAIAAVALLAASLSARKATSINPAVVLRSDG